MAINYELINKGGISLGTNFELLSEKPLDSRLVVPSLDGLQNYIDSAAAYEGMIVYVSSEKKHYEVKVIEGVLSYRPFGLTDIELNDIITNATTAAMEFKGATATLPENPAKGDMYKVAGENINIKIDDVDAKLGDSIVYNGEQWFLIPSGDDIEDTWRPVDGVNNDATLKFADGDKTVAAVAADGTIKYNHATVATPADITAEGDEKTRTYITAVETDGYGHITGYKTATENVEDTNTEYTFESQVESSSVYFNVTPNTEDATEETIYVDAYSKNEADAAFKAKRAEALAAIETETNIFVDTVAQDVDGNITITTKAVDFTAVTNRLDELEKIDHSHTFADSDVEDAITKKHAHTFADTDVEDAIAKKHSHTFVESELNEIKAGDVAKWNAAEQNAKDYADGLAENYDEAGAAAGVKTELEAEIIKKVDKESYETDKATFATKTELGDVDNKFADYKTAADQKLVDDAQDVEIAKKVDKVDGKDLIATSEIERLATLKNYDDTALAGRVTTAEGKISALETESAKHALKTEVEAVDAKFADYNTTVAQKAIDDAQDARIKAIEDDYLVEADIANFETKENVEKVADDLAAYIESNNAAIADRYTKEEADGKFALITDAYDDTELVNRVKAIEDDYLVEADKTALQEQITANANAITLLTEGVDADKVDGVKDLIDYVDKHGTEVTGIKADIAANAKAIEDHEALAAETYETKDDAAAKLAEAKEYADDINTALDARLDTLEAINHEAYTAADATLKAELQAEIDADVKVVNDALEGYKTSNDAEVAKKANSADVYAKTETYTQAEVDALISAAHTWGEF